MRLDKAAIALVFLLSSGTPALADTILYGYYAITNPDARAATDLFLTFNTPVRALGAATADAKSKSYKSATPEANTVHFFTGSVPMDKSDMGSVGFIKGQAAIALTTATFSYPVGNDVNVPVPQVAFKIKVGAIRPDGKAQASLELENEETERMVFFNNFQAGVDIPSGLFDTTDPVLGDLMIDKELFVADFPVNDLAPFFLLLPGETKTIDLGLVSGENFAGAIFTAGFTSTPLPGDLRFGFVANTIVPEPSTWITIGLGAPVILGYAIGLGRQRRRRAPPRCPP
jgi:hypothetical protein